MQIEKDSLTKTARKNWSEGAAGKAPFKADLVAKIYREELQGTKTQPPKLRRIMLLEISQYLENYLIPNCTEARTFPVLQSQRRIFRGCMHDWDCPWHKFFHCLKELALVVRRSATWHF